MKFKLLLLALILSLGSVVNAQVLLEGANTFSGKKDAFITLKDGTEIVGTIRSVKRKKRLIKEIKIKDKNGKKLDYMPEDVKSMYLPQSGFDKIKLTVNIEEFEGGTLDGSRLKDGYAYFEQVEVYYKKKKKKTLLLQVLNPSFCNGIKIYYDPLADGTMSTGIGPLRVGGLAKSYFMKRGDEVAFKIKKKNYREEYTLTFKKCKAVIKKYGKKGKWKELGRHVAEYSVNCGE